MFALATPNTKHQGDAIGSKLVSKPETKVANRHNAELNRITDNSSSDSSEEEVTNRAINYGSIGHLFLDPLYRNEK